MNPTVEVALIVGAFGFLGPLAMAIVQYLLHVAEKRQDYARQDAVAAQAAEATRLLAERQEDAAVKAEIVAKSLLEANAKVAATAKIAANAVKGTNRKLDQIHMLVNSNMTAALQAELSATQRELAMMIEVISLKRVAGQEPTEEALLAVGATESKIKELSLVLVDRMKAQQSLDLANQIDQITADK